jgi:hypothetical protein
MFAYRLIYPRKQMQVVIHLRAAENLSQTGITDLSIRFAHRILFAHSTQRIGPLREQTPPECAADRAGSRVLGVHAQPCARTQEPEKFRRRYIEKLMTDEVKAKYPDWSGKPDNGVKSICKDGE